MCKIILEEQTNTRPSDKSRALQHQVTTLLVKTWTCDSSVSLPCLWCVWWAAPTLQLPLLDTGPPAWTGGCWPDCRRPSLGPASHPSYCRRDTNHIRLGLYSPHQSNHWTPDVHRTVTDPLETHTHTPVNTGGVFEQCRVPAQVDDIIVLTEVLPCDPENTWRETQGNMWDINEQEIDLTIWFLWEIRENIKKESGEKYTRPDEYHILFSSFSLIFLKIKQTFKPIKNK